MKRFEKKSDIKVGVVGYGAAFNMGPGHLKGMEAAGMTPAAVCDTDESRLEVAQADFPGIQTFKSLAEMLEKGDVDLITLITPHNTHAELATKCLNAGKHVVCEKPFAITTSECDEMIAAAEQNGCMLSTYHNRHWDGHVLHALETVGSGAIGDIVRVEAHMGGYSKPGDWWRSSKTISGGVLYDWGVHLLEYMLQIVDGPIEEVTGFARTGFWAEQTAWREDTNEDEAYAVIRFGGGIWGTLKITTIDLSPRPGVMEIFGTKGVYVMDLQQYTLITQENGETIRRSGKNPAGEYHKYYENIAAHLTEGEELVITPEWARRPIHILDLAGQSAVKGQAIPATYE
jgi:predicted dehydrogenase